MEAFALYLFRSAIWLTGFAMVYFLFLRNERFFFLKRIYLVSGILISFFFPLISVHYQVELPVPDINPVDFTPAVIQQVSPDEPFDYRFILLFIYITGILFFALRLIWHIRLLCRTINKANFSSRHQTKLIRASEFSASFSFFNYIFINPSVSEIEVVEIMNHELVHVRQKHWFDLMFVEMLCLIQWVNPFAWIYTRFIRMNHEYLADEMALQRTSNPVIYKAALVNQLFSSPVISLSNSFNYSLNKKRFDMMKKIITSPYRKMKILFILPVVAIIFYSFAKPEYHYALPVENQLTVYQTSEIIAPEVKRNIVKKADGLLPGNAADNTGINNLTSVIIANVVKGTVVQEDGKPLQGVTINVSTELVRAISDAEGHFVIKKVPEDAYLVFSHKDYKPQILKAVFTSEMNVKFLKDPDYKLQAINDEEIIIRDLSSPPTQTKPLILIDGVESTSGMNMILPSEISTISVLKDASATAVFGDKGANGVIIVTTKKKAAGSIKNKSAEANTAALQQPSVPSTIVEKVVSGTVVQQDGKPLGGAIIIVKGTTTGVVSDAKGYFRVSNVPDEALLVVSYVGFKTKVIKPVFTAEMSVQMMRDRVTTGSVNINPSPSSPPSSSPVSFKSGNNKPLPLYVVDGIITNIDINKIDPNTIESISVRKDKSATDKYGEQGKDGVIEIITQKYDSLLKKDMSDVKVTGYSSVQKTDKDLKIFVEEMPMFPGGEKSMLNWISKNVKYPAEAVRDKITGQVNVNFVVSSTGKIKDVQVNKPVHPLLDTEAKRVISNMPDWKPGSQNGNPVDIDYMVPVDFKLQ